MGKLQVYGGMFLRYGSEAVAQYITKLWSDIKGTDAVINIQLVKFAGSVNANNTFLLTSATTEAQLNQSSVTIEF